MGYNEMLIRDAIHGLDRDGIVISVKFGAMRAPDVMRPGDMRANMPRFLPENLGTNLRLVESLRSIGEGRGASVAQIAIAWALSRGHDIVPLVGTTEPERVKEAIEAVEIDSRTMTSPRSTERCRPPPWRGSGTTSARWPCSTANGAPSVRDPAGRTPERGWDARPRGRVRERAFQASVAALAAAPAARE